MTKKQPINIGKNTHDGKNFHMFAPGSKNRKKGWKPRHSSKSGKSYSKLYPDGKRRKK